MLEEIGNIVVIGLEARKDRWTRCKEILQGAGVSQVTHYTTTQDFSDTHRHYMKDFLQMLRVRGFGKHLVFFEDDFELMPEWEQVLQKAWRDLPEDFDMLYLGCNLTRPPQIITENLVRVKGAYLMHATILSKKFIEYLLKTYDYNRIWIIDEWYRQIAPERKFYMTYPMVSYQRPDYSDFLGQYVDYKTIQYNNNYYKAIYENLNNGSRLPSDTERRCGVDAA
jgi:hypothetical protein